MKYNGWKMMDEVGVAVCSQKPDTWRGKEQFDGYLFGAKDKKAREKAEDWARRYDNKYDNTKETIVYEPNVHIFENKGFTVTILDSAGGSSQGGRLSFWKCKVEKDGVEFIVGVNDSILADLIRNSHIDLGVIREKVMFVRNSGAPGFIHENMEAYKEAMADTKQKTDLKKAKKTNKWEIGGVYLTLTQTDICLGDVWDTLEPYEVQESYSSYRWGSRTTTKYRKRETPVKVTAWISPYHSKDGVKSFTDMLKTELESNYIHFSTGKPPARSKASQLEVKESDLKLIDEMLSKKREYGRYAQNEDTTGRYKREL